MHINIYLRECIVAATILLFLSMFILAEGSDIKNKQIFVGPRAAYSIPKDANRGQLDSGVQARVHLLTDFGLEGSIDYRSDNYFDLTIIKTYPVQASLLVYFRSEGVIKPFLLGGVGWYFTQVNGPFGFRQTNFRFGQHIGAGLELMVRKSISIDGSCRYVWLESVESRYENTTNKNYQDSGFMITLAINFLFQFKKVQQ